jgi:glycosyltransferase involved in cell wall biosynthesis
MDTNTKPAEIDPKVSVVICTYNRAQYLPQAIESVLVQSFQDFELIVVDDASKDNTQTVMEKYISNNKVRYIKNSKNLGLGKNRVESTREARGEYIAILDSDDYWVDVNKISKQVDFLDKNKNVGVVGTFGKIVNDKNDVIGNLEYKTNNQDIRKKILSYHQFLHSSVLFRKDAFIELGGYDETLSPAEDFDLILKIGKRYEMANLSEYTTHYRIHSENSSSKDRQKRLNHAKLHLKVIKKFKKDYPNYFSALIKSYLRTLINL